MVDVARPQTDLLQRLRAIVRDDAPPSRLDDQELADRLEATEAFFGETEQHFVDYVEEMVRTSTDATKEVRAMQQEAWDTYQEKEPPNYAEKEPWQSRVVLPKPYSAVQFAKAAIRRAFSPQFLSVQHPTRPEIGELWEKVLLFYFNQQHANFPVRFTDATEMGFAVGVSMEMIPYWNPRVGLQIDLIEPWKIYRDPDAASRLPQSGMYWIHAEFQDLWFLRQQEAAGVYTNIAALDDEFHTQSPQDAKLSQEAIARRKQYLWQRNKFRRAVLVYEYWGTILDHRGEVLLPNATYTVAAGKKVIGLPQINPYPTLRWPGIAFSPLPHLLRHEGRSLLEGIIRLWRSMCTLMSLHVDYLNWIVNPMLEVILDLVVDQEDLDVTPGRMWLVKDSQQGQQVVRSVDRRQITGDILANLQYYDQNFQRGTFVTDPVQGLPGFRSDITAREAAQNLDQAMTVFGMMGNNIEDGAIQAIAAAMEIIQAFITIDDLAVIVSPDELALLREQQRDAGTLLPSLENGGVSVSGLAAILKDAEVMRTIREILIPLTQSPLFLPFLKPYNILKSIEMRTNLRDEHVLVTEAEAQQILQAQEHQAATLQQRQQAAQEMAAQLQERELAQADADLEHRQAQTLATIRNGGAPVSGGN